jgi:glutamine---fructose-6-phosphate transaminase (isomerizing)
MRLAFQTLPTRLENDMSQFIKELYSQPQTLRRLITQFQMPAIPMNFDKLIFTGMGSSFCAAHFAANLLLKAGVYALAVEASELLHYQLPLVSEGSLVVVISQSGYSAEIIKLINVLNQPILAVTNNPTSPLALQSDYCIEIVAGKECAASTKTYTNTLAALYLFVQALLGKSSRKLLPTVELIEKHLPLWAKQLQAITAARHSVFIGRGASYASAMMSALIYQEAIKRPAQSFNAGQFRHGPIEALTTDARYFIFEGNPTTAQLNQQLAAMLRQWGQNTITIGHDCADIELPACDEDLLPLLEIIPIQLLIAQTATQANIDVDVFRYGQKIVYME